MRTHSRARIIVLTTLAALLATVYLSPSPATATDEPQATGDFPYYQTESWLLPASWDRTVTPYHTTEIFPQDWISSDETIPCDRWVQVDNYFIEDQADLQTLFTLGAVLDQGEDSRIYAGHEFVYGGDCYVEPPITLIDAPTPTITPATGFCIDEKWVYTPATVTLNGTANGRWQDGLDGQTVVLNGSETTYSWTTAEGPYAANPDVLPSGNYFTSRFENGFIYFTFTTNAVESEECAITTPPTDRPPVVEEPTVEPLAVEEPVVLAAATTPVVLPAALAVTGTREDMLTGSMWIAGILLAAGGALLVLRRRTT